MKMLFADTGTVLLYFGSTMLFSLPMDLLTYISDMPRRQLLATKCETSTQYLWQLATGWRDRKPSIDLAKRIEESTNGQVSRHELRPDIFDVPDQREAS